MDHAHLFTFLKLAERALECFRALASEPLLPRQHVGNRKTTGPAHSRVGKTVQVAFRLDEDLVKRLDKYANQLEREMPGFKVSRADAVQLLLIRALDKIESGRTKKNPG